MARLTVMCARSMHVAAAALGRAFATASGHAVDFDFGTVGALQEKLDRGGRADVLILSVAMIDKLEGEGALLPGSRRDMARTYIAVCIKAGAMRPDISTPEAFAQTLRDAPAVATSDPAVGGTAGVYLAKLFDRIGLGDAMRSKGLPQKSGVEVARRVAEGIAPLGLTLSGEIAAVEGVEIAGPLPPPIGHDTTYCAAVAASSAEPEAARALIAAMTTPSARATWRQAGFEVP